MKSSSHSITSSSGLSGKTLCGRPFPAAKGYPVAVRYRKRCLSVAKKAGARIAGDQRFGLRPITGGVDQ